MSEQQNLQWEQIEDDVYKVHSRAAVDSAYANWLSDKHDEIAFDEVVLEGGDNADYPMVVTFRYAEDGPDIASVEDMDAIMRLWSKS